MASNRFTGCLASPRFAARPLARRRLFAAALLILSLAGAARAQLDLGSPEIPRDKIDGYLRPFYRLVATAAGSDRLLPPPHSALAWNAGLDAVIVPMPGGQPFDRVDLSALPLFRAGAGIGAFDGGIAGRGLVWRDPRIGDLATFGAGIGYGRPILSGSFPLVLSLLGGWDYLSFGSSYIYHYRASPLGLFNQDVRGDYTLQEHLLAVGSSLALRRGPWGATLQGWYEWAYGRFRYLYYDPSSGDKQTVVSNLDVPGMRVVAGISWRGLRAEAGFRSYPAFALGWAWER